MRSLGYLIALAIICTGCELKHKQPIRYLSYSEYHAQVKLLEEQFNAATEALLRLGAITEKIAQGYMKWKRSCINTGNTDEFVGTIPSLVSACRDSHENAVIAIGAILDVSQGDTQQAKQLDQLKTILEWNEGYWIGNPAVVPKGLRVQDFLEGKYKGMSIPSIVTRTGMAILTVRPIKNESPKRYASRIRKVACSFSDAEVKRKEDELRALWHTQA
jgi:hypothetical protein